MAFVNEIRTINDIPLADMYARELAEQIKEELKADIKNLSANIKELLELLEDIKNNEVDKSEAVQDLVWKDKY